MKKREIKRATLWRALYAAFVRGLGEDFTPGEFACPPVENIPEKRIDRRRRS